MTQVSPLPKSSREDGKMPERIANKIILAEDIEQQNLVRRYLERCGHGEGIRPAPLPAQVSGGSGEKYVRDHYAEQVRACRSALGRRTKALLVVMVDADMETTKHRADQLSKSLASAGMTGRDDREPIVVLIPKRHVETWIRALRGIQVDEEADYKRPKPTSAEICGAAERLHEWTRPNAVAIATFPPSLTASRPEWRRIPE
jgi:hypothetical protein